MILRLLGVASLSSLLAVSLEYWIALHSFWDEQHRIGGSAALLIGIVGVLVLSFRYLGRYFTFCFTVSGFLLTPVLMFWRFDSQKILGNFATEIAWKAGLVAFGLGLAFALSRYLRRGRIAYWIAVGSIVLTLVLDLIVSFRQAAYLYTGFESSIESLAPLTRLPQQFVPLGSRGITPASSWKYEQAMRYPEVLLGEVRLLAPIRRITNDYSRARIGNFSLWPRAVYPEIKINEIQYLMNLGHRPEWFDYDVKAEPTFTDLLRSKRWNYFYAMPLAYNLLFANLSAESVQTIYTIGQAAFQFRSGAIFVPSADTLQALKELDSTIDGRNELKTKIVLEDKVVVRPQNAASTAKNSLMEANFQFRFVSPIENYDHFSMQTRARIPGFLYWAENFDPAWEALRDGQPVEILRANHALKALELPAGESTFTFQYNPWQFRLALNIFDGILLVTITAIAFCLSAKLRQRVRNA